MTPLPAHIRESLVAYRDQRRPTGSCLRAALSNDLIGTFNRADPETAAAMPAICRWLFNELPGNAWGSPAAVDAWLAEGRKAAS